MRLCKNHGELPDDSFFVRSSGFCPHLCRVCERDRAKLRRRARYADPAERARILAQNRSARARPARPSHPAIVLPETSVLLAEIRAKIQPIPALKETPEGIFEKLQNVALSNPLPQGTVGINYLDNMFPHRIDARTEGLPSLRETLADDRELMRIVQYLVQGDPPRYPKPEYVLRNARFTARMPSHFFPQSAAAIFQAYGAGLDCYDPFAGWGGRALAAICSGVRSLVSTDLQQKSVDSCRRMAEEFSGLSKVETEFRHEDFSQYMVNTDRRFSLIFTSPPFASTEDYNNGVDNRTFRDWTQKVVLPLVSGSKRVLAPSGKVVLHGQDRRNLPVLSTLLSSFLSGGFQLEQEYRYGKKEGQSILVFSLV